MIEYLKIDFKTTHLRSSHEGHSSWLSLWRMLKQLAVMGESKKLAGKSILARKKQC